MIKSRFPKQRKCDHTRGSADMVLAYKFKNKEKTREYEHYECKRCNYSRNF
jgi:hypothetical protein